MRQKMKLVLLVGLMVQPAFAALTTGPGMFVDFMNTKRNFTATDLVAFVGNVVGFGFPATKYNSVLLRGQISSAKGTSEQVLTSLYGVYSPGKTYSYSSGAGTSTGTFFDSSTTYYRTISGVSSIVYGLSRIWTITIGSLNTTGSFPGMQGVTSISYTVGTTDGNYPSSATCTAQTCLPAPYPASGSDNTATVTLTTTSADNYFYVAAVQRPKNDVAVNTLYVSQAIKGTSGYNYDGVVLHSNGTWTAHPANN